MPLFNIAFHTPTNDVIVSLTGEETSVGTLKSRLRMWAESQGVAPRTAVHALTQLLASHSVLSVGHSKKAIATIDLVCSNTGLTFKGESLPFGFVLWPKPTENTRQIDKRTLPLPY